MLGFIDCGLLAKEIMMLFPEENNITPDINSAIKSLSLIVLGSDSNPSMASQKNFSKSLRNIVEQLFKLQNGEQDFEVNEESLVKVEDLAQQAVKWRVNFNATHQFSASDIEPLQPEKKKKKLDPENENADKPAGKSTDSRQKRKTFRQPKSTRGNLNKIKSKPKVVLQSAKPNLNIDPKVQESRRISRSTSNNVSADLSVSTFVPKGEAKEINTNNKELDKSQIRVIGSSTVVSTGVTQHIHNNGDALVKMKSDLSPLSIDQDGSSLVGITDKKIAENVMIEGFPKAEASDDKDKCTPCSIEIAKALRNKIKTATNFLETDQQNVHHPPKDDNELKSPQTASLSLKVDSIDTELSEIQAISTSEVPAYDILETQDTALVADSSTSTILAKSQEDQDIKASDCRTTTKEDCPIESDVLSVEGDVITEKTKPDPLIVMDHSGEVVPARKRPVKKSELKHIQQFNVLMSSFEGAYMKPRRAAVEAKLRMENSSNRISRRSLTVKTEQKLASQVPSDQVESGTLPSSADVGTASPDQVGSDTTLGGDLTTKIESVKVECAMEVCPYPSQTDIVSLPNPDHANIDQGPPSADLKVDPASPRTNTEAQATPVTDEGNALFTQSITPMKDDHELTSTQVEPTSLLEKVDGVTNISSFQVQTNPLQSDLVTEETTLITKSSDDVKAVTEPTPCKIETLPLPHANNVLAELSLVVANKVETTSERKDEVDNSMVNSVLDSASDQNEVIPKVKSKRQRRPSKKMQDSLDSAYVEVPVRRSRRKSVNSAGNKLIENDSMNKSMPEKSDNDTWLNIEEVENFFTKLSVTPPKTETCKKSPKKFTVIKKPTDTLKASKCTVRAKKGVIKEVKQAEYLLSKAHEDDKKEEVKPEVKEVKPTVVLEACEPHDSMDEEIEVGESLRNTDPLPGKDEKTGSAANSGVSREPYQDHQCGFTEESTTDSASERNYPDFVLNCPKKTAKKSVKKLTVKPTIPANVQLKSNPTPKTVSPRISHALSKTSLLKPGTILIIPGPTAPSSNSKQPNTKFDLSKINQFLRSTNFSQLNQSLCANQASSVTTSSQKGPRFLLPNTGSRNSPVMKCNFSQPMTMNSPPRTISNQHTSFPVANRVTSSIRNDVTQMRTPPPRQNTPIYHPVPVSLSSVPVSLSSVPVDPFTFDPPTQHSASKKVTVPGEAGTRSGTSVEGRQTYSNLAQQILKDLAAMALKTGNKENLSGKK
ncbi:uncharacterized protein LOC134812859 [Bolinopsis microptera]|uniref:uncharacterized protein LOC134812859 n=1 Tax=Bolinopsis microptera TaxID=2820187 RepID=UPI003079C0AD